MQTIGAQTKSSWPRTWHAPTNQTWVQNELDTTGRGARPRGAALHARRHFLPVHELGTGPVHAVTQPAADGSGRSSRGRWRQGSQSRARTHVGGGWPARPGHPPRWGRPRAAAAVRARPSPSVWSRGSLDEWLRRPRRRILGARFHGQINWVRPYRVGGALHGSEGTDRLTGCRMPRFQTA